MKQELERWLDVMLQEESFEDILERFNLTPHEAMEILFEAGFIDEELIT